MPGLIEKLNKYERAQALYQILAVGGVVALAVALGHMIKKEIE